MFDLYKQGVINLDQIDLEKTPLNTSQTIQVNSEVDGSSHIDKPKIREFINIF